MINVNSQQCGAGKTTQWIYPNIRKLLLQSQKVLLVVPSIDLQIQYAETFTRHITVINNQNSASVSKAIYEAFDNGNKFICITHQAFEQLALSFTVKRNYNLIIDEVINPIRLQKINFDADNKYMPNFKFSNIFKFKDKEYFSHKDVDYTKDKSWHKLNVAKVNDLPFLVESKKWKDLLHDNFISYMQYENYMNLCKQNKKQISIIQELNPVIMMHWVDVYVAGAAFECTFMRYWMDYNELEYDVVEKFEQHDTKIRLHAPSIDDFKWSKHKKNKHTEILDKYHKYVKANTTNPLVIRNNDEVREIAGEVRVSHNVHGMNLINKHNIISVSLETALVPDYQLKDFYRNVLDMKDKQITKAFSSYLFYQVVMRTAIRDDIPVDVFALDVNTIVGLIDFFSDIELIEKIDVSYTQKQAGRPKRTAEEKATTKREYQRKYMAKRRKSRPLL